MAIDYVRMCAFLAAALPLVGGTAAWADSMRVDLSASSMGSLPKGFTTALTGGGGAVAWSVIEDASAPGGRALAQTSADRTDYRFPLAIDNNVSAKDVEVSARFKAVAGRTDQAAGLMVRVKDAGNYYVVRANALEDNVNLYKVVNGARREITGKSVKVPSGQWLSLALRAEGNRFTVSFNGAPLFTATDETLVDAGKVGLWTKADGVTSFADIAITPLP
jgi:hypothetical protein